MAVESYKLTDEKIKCKKCGYVINAAMGDGGRRPKEGDFSVCGGCATIGRYEADNSVTPMSQGALEIMEEHDPEGYMEIQNIVSIVKQIIKNRE